MTTPASGRWEAPERGHRGDARLLRTQLALLPRSVSFQDRHSAGLTGLTGSITAARAFRYFTIWKNEMLLIFRRGFDAAV